MSLLQRARYGLVYSKRDVNKRLNPFCLEDYAHLCRRTIVLKQMEDEGILVQPGAFHAHDSAGLREGRKAANIIQPDGHILRSVSNGYFDRCLIL